MSDDTELTGEAARELALVPPLPAGEAKAPEQSLTPPCTIYRKTPGAIPFVVEDLGAWQYQELGVFASGHWNGQHTVRDVMVFYDNIDFIEFDFDAVQTVAVAEEVPDEQPVA